MIDDLDVAGWKVLTALDRALLAACEAADPKAVAECLAKGAGNGCCDPERGGATPLILAVVGGSLECARLILEHPSTDADSTDAKGCTALMWAAMEVGTPGMVALIASRSNVDQELVECMRSPWTALHFAARTCAEHVEVLAPLSKKDWGAGELSPLMVAAAAGSAQSVEALLGRWPGTARIMSSDGGGQCAMNALMHAASSGNAEAAEALLADSDPDATTREGMNALMMAALGGHRNVVDVLKPRTAPRQDARGKTALIFAAFLVGLARKSDGAGCVEALLDYDDPKAVDVQGRTALMFAAGSGDARSCALLAPRSEVWRRCLVGQRFFGMSALDFAAARGATDCVEALLARAPRQPSRFSALTKGLVEKRAGRWAMASKWPALGRLLGEAHPLAAAQAYADEHGKNAETSALLREYRRALDESRALGAVAKPSGKKKGSSSL